jgi:hypothetical protein
MLFRRATIDALDSIFISTLNVLHEDPMLLRPKKKDGVDPRERSLWGSLLSLGFVFPIAIVLGYYIGRWVGGKFGNPYAGGLVGLGWGIFTGFWELFKVSKRLEKYDKLSASGDSDGSGGGQEDGKGGSDGP